MTVALQSIQCALCGASITVPHDLDRLSCTHCGTPLAIVRGEGYFSAILAQQTSVLTPQSVLRSAVLRATLTD